MKNRSFLFIATLLILSAIITWRLYFKVYLQSDTVSIHNFPKEIGEWKATEIPITDGEYAILETRNVFVRKYTNTSGQSVFLFIVYSQNNRKVSHPPEICYTGSGATILSNVSQSIHVESPKLTIKANKIFIEQQDIHQVMYYWFKVGDSFTSNYWKQQFLIMVKTMTGKPASSALIRLSADVKEEAPQQGPKSIEEFTRIITPLLLKYLP